MGVLTQKTMVSWFGSVLLGAAVAGAQTPAPDCNAKVDAQGKIVVDPSCQAPAPTGTQPAAPNSNVPLSQRFPFPGESSSSQTTAPDKAAAPQDPSATGKTSGDSNTPVSKRFPFPGEGANSDTSAPGGLKDAGSSGSSSSSDRSGESSSSSSSSSASDGGNPSAGPLGDDDDAAAKAAAERKSSRKRMPKGDRQSPSEREEEDIQVAGYYQNEGNWKAMYMRATDAVSLTEDDPEAHILLAEAARRLGKLDEAQKHYKRCLELDPLPKDKKAAEKALKEMSGGK